MEKMIIINEKIFKGILSEDGMVGHFWRDKRKTGTKMQFDYLEWCHYERNQCITVMGLQYYDLMSMESFNAYDDYPIMEHMEYLGYGKVYSVHGTRQRPF